MPRIYKTAILPYSPEQLYSLVNNVRAYPEFLPWCYATEVLAESPTEINATVTVGKGGIQKTFATQNSMTPNEKIKIALLNGPFKKLTGSWIFNPYKDEKTKISIDLEFEFNSHWMERAFSAIVSQAANNLMKAFIQRAQEIFR